jgi:type IV pilus assembly protein PilE
VRTQISRSGNQGFTLIELMIVVVIIGILSAIAYPNYTQYVIDSRRATAAACLSEQAQLLERQYTTTLTYADAVLPNAQQCRTDLAGFYTFPAPTLAARTYTITAVPQSGQASNDRKCGCTLSLNQTGAKAAAGENASCADAGRVAACWR